MNKTDTIKQIKLYLFDMDGTLYLGDRLFDFTNELLLTIRNSGADYRFITNNSSKSVVDYVKKLDRLGIHSTPDDFVTSSQATGYYLKNNHPDATLYVCGTQSLKDELARCGFAITEDLDRVDCIVMGFDTELTFKKLEDVCKLLFARDLPYIATNPDYVCPTEYGSVPDCGSVCDMIYNATKKRPVIIGKPSPLIVELSMAATGIDRKHTAVVGDRIYTDIKCGLNAGAVSILVMNGETTEEILDASPEKPDLVLSSGEEILNILKGNAL